MQLTKELFEEGLVDVSLVKVHEMHLFCQANGIPVECKGGGKKKTTMLNEIVDWLEKESGVVKEEGVKETETVSVESEPIEEPKAEEPKIRENGEVIRLASNGEDYGSNCVNRIRSH